MASPPPCASKKDVLRFLSVNNIVNAPARTGKANNNKIAVIKIPQTKRATIIQPALLVLIFRTVEMKFKAPNKEDTPAKCNEKMTKSTDPPE